MKDCVPWEGPHAGAGGQQEEGAVEMKCHDLTRTPWSPAPLGGGGRRVGSEAGPGKKVVLTLFLFLTILFWYQLALS